FSNYGFGINVSAPGGGFKGELPDAYGMYNILSTMPDNSEIADSRPQLQVSSGYWRIAGTSMACPHVAGVAALIKSRYPDAQPDEIRGRIMAGADNIDSLNPDFKNCLGAGRINAYQSLITEPAPLIRLTEIKYDEMTLTKTGNIKVYLKSFWGKAINVEAVLSTYDPRVTLNQSSANFGDINADETKSNSLSPFNISISPGFPAGEAIDLQLTITAGGGYEKTYDFAIPVTYFAAVKNTRLPLEDSFTTCLSTGDYDNDGYTDVIVTGMSDDEARFYRNNHDGSFVQVNDDTGVHCEARAITSLFFDLNNDGFQDILVGQVVNSLGTEDPADDIIGYTKLFLNNGNGMFTDISLSSGISDFTHCRSAIALDYNNDSFTDILLGSQDDSQSIALMRNNGNGTFSNVTNGAGISKIPHTYPNLVAFDYDNDGDQDLFVTGEFNLDNRHYLYRNNGDGTFTDCAAAAGIDIARGGAFGAAAGDYNNDGFIDLYVAGLMTSPSYGVRPSKYDALYMNNGDGTFTDVSEQAGDPGTTQEGMHYGNDFFDFDNDGYLDLYIAEGGLSPEKNALFRNNRDGTFTAITDKAFYAFVRPAFGASVIFDYNNDGAMDVYALSSTFFSAGGDGAFFENMTGTKNNWIKIKLEGSVSARDAHGAKIYVTAGGRTQLREVHSSPVQTQPVNFGLGNETFINEIEVCWPSGLTQKVTGVAANQIIVISEAATEGPFIYTVIPNAVYAGDTVTITGRNFGAFSGTACVKFGNNAGVEVISWSDTEITCKIPVDAVSDVIRVITETGASNKVRVAVKIGNPPVNLTGNIVYPYKIALTWQDNCQGEDGFIIERGEESGGPFTQVGTSSYNNPRYIDTGVIEGRTYYYRVCAYNSAGNSGYSNIAMITPGMILITAPENLRISSSGGISALYIAWTDCSNNEDGFIVERSESPDSGFAQIAVVSSANVTYADYRVAIGITYYYRVCAYNDVGNSAYSNVLEAKLTMPAPSNLKAQAVSPTQINLSWMDHSTSEEGFIIERSESPDTGFAVVATLPADTITYNDAEVSGTTAHYYRICAYDSTGNSAYSNIAKSTVFICAPTDLAGEAVSSTKIRLTWKDNSDNETYFMIYRKYATDPHYEHTNSANRNATTYLSEYLKPSTTYYYVVRAFNNSGYSEFSNEISVTTLANSPPVLDPIDNKIVNEGQPLQFTISGTDVDGDYLTYSTSAPPADGMVFKGKTGAYSWTPTPFQAGEYAMTFTVSDGQLSDSETISINVLDTIDEVAPGESIQDAVNNAAAGDTLYIGGGTYEGDINVQNKNITIRGISVFDTTIKGNISSCNSNSSIEDLTIIYKQGSTITYSNEYYTDFKLAADAGITAVNSDITVRNCTIMPDFDIFGIDKFGKGIQIWNLYGNPDIAPLIENCEILNADAGIYLYSQVFGGAILGEIKNNQLENNNCSIVMRMHKEKPLIQDNAISYSMNGIHITYEDDALLEERLSNIITNTFHSNTCDIWCDETGVIAKSYNNLIRNSGFEESFWPPAFWSEWSGAAGSPEDGGAYGYIYDMVSHSGRYCVVRGLYGTTIRWGGFSQDVAVNPGDFVMMNGWLMSPESKPLSNGAEAHIELVFLSADGTELIKHQSAQLTSGSGWVRRSITQTAPAGTTTARINFVLVGTNDSSSGEVYFDDAFLSAASQ
ncbi:MAG: FG-GAP-like repeat-containing protein, partial [Candidatus Omnitrophica bacterium]|nr:FG-GAP-like repeat-containing protein [Candidatus Omnitrophota bacterium]